MKAIIVFESMYGNTAHIARAIAEGIGPDARVMSTAHATPEVVAAADLIVAGAPVHAMGLPSQSTRETAIASPIADGRVAANPNHPPMREWLDGLAPGHGRAAAFDTRVRGPFGRGAAPAIASGLGKAGYTVVDPPRGFYVNTSTHDVAPGGLLRPGEVQQAMHWGRSLAASARQLAS